MLCAKCNVLWFHPFLPLQIVQVIRKHFVHYVINIVEGVKWLRDTRSLFL